MFSTSFVQFMIAIGIPVLMTIVVDAVQLTM
jgi:hypothetical protein